ncbi:MAG: hypothetical protein KC933_12670 [Myxococcales bacterium]|nr:hypothetical protein [Myxococcales bacterium]
MSAPRDPAWTEAMARQVARRVRWSMRLSWAAAALTVVGTALLVFTPESADGPGLTDVVVRDAPPAARGAVGARPVVEGGTPVRMRLAQAPGGEDEPVDIRF